MKNPWVVSVVVALHCLGGFLLLQGCETVRGPVPASNEVVMPPPAQPAGEPAVQPEPETPRRVKPWPTETTTYVIKRGDSLSVIANKYGLSVKELAAINGINDADKIFIGQKLVLPAGLEMDGVKTPATTQAAPAPAVATPAGSPGTYTVQRGDCLSVIAVRTGTKTAALRKANNLTGDKIIVGQQLVIPAGGHVAAPVPSPAAPEAAPPVSAAVDAPAVEEEEAVPVAAPIEQPVAIAPEPGPAVAPAPTAFRTHVVEEEEDLFSVAMMWGVSVARICELNGLTEDATLKAGQELKIPITE